MSKQESRYRESPGYCFAPIGESKLVRCGQTSKYIRGLALSAALIVGLLVPAAALPSPPSNAFRFFMTPTVALRPRSTPKATLPSTTGMRLGTCSRSRGRPRANFQSFS